jgi:transcription antitermination factor NusG
VIAKIRRRKVRGLIEVPKRIEFQPGDPVRVTDGPLAGCSGLYVGMRASERVEVLLALLGRMTLPKGNIEIAYPDRR